MGRDLGHPSKDCEAVVSIHAPAWGATRGITTGSIEAASFNPRARMGRDNKSTTQNEKHLCFNPRARMGRDHNLRAWSGCLSLFQSTRPHGARPIGKRYG